MSRGTATRHPCQESLAKAARKIASPMRCKWRAAQLKNTKTVRASRTAPPTVRTTSKSVRTASFSSFASRKARLKIICSFAPCMERWRSWCSRNRKWRRETIDDSHLKTKCVDSTAYCRLFCTDISFSKELAITDYHSVSLIGWFYTLSKFKIPVMFFVSINIWHCQISRPLTFPQIYPMLFLTILLFTNNPSDFLQNEQ